MPHEANGAHAAQVQTESWELQSQKSCRVGFFSVYKASFSYIQLI
jgi:hypothetical protein